MKNDYTFAFDGIVEERGLSSTVILEAVEAAMEAAYRKSVGMALASQKIKAHIDFDNQKVTIFVEKEVTDSIIDERTEVLLEDARKVEPDCQLGDLVMVDSTPTDFGRTAAMAAKMAITQKVRDGERQLQLDHYKKQVGELVNGTVQAINREFITVVLDYKAEATMDRKEMIVGEHFRLHERIKAYLYEVNPESKGALVIKLSRTNSNFLRRLLEMEIPEIYHGIVEIRSIAREPGQRAKVAVSATQQGIDAVGACVGQRGNRIQSIVKELHDEKIDVVEWSADQAEFISKAISPARVNAVYLNPDSDDKRKAVVVVPEDQLSLAIGKLGVNARLAALLTNWKIDILSVNEAASRMMVKVNSEERYARMLTDEAELLAKINEILQKKAEGVALNLDESNSLARFVDRVQRYDEVDRKQEESQRSSGLKAARASIDPRAFEINIFDVPGIREHHANCLTEAGISNFGDLLLQYKVDADRILSFNGISVRTFADIRNAIETFKFPEDENAPSEVEALPLTEQESDSEVSKAEVGEVIRTEEPVEEKPFVEELPEALHDDSNESFADLLNADGKHTTVAKQDIPRMEEEFARAGHSKKAKSGKKRKVYEYDEEAGMDYRASTRGDEDDWKNY